MCEDRIQKLMDAGVKITINSDDPSYMGEQYVEENLVKLQKTMSLTKVQLCQFQRNAVAISWADADTKQTLLDEIDTYLKQNS
jgi:adenosine deaminase